MYVCLFLTRRITWAAAVSGHSLETYLGVKRKVVCAWLNIVISLLISYFGSGCRVFAEPYCRCLRMYSAHNKGWTERECLFGRLSAWRVAALFDEDLSPWSLSLFMFLTSVLFFLNKIAWEVFVSLKSLHFHYNSFLVTTGKTLCFWKKNTRGHITCETERQSSSSVLRCKESSGAT